MNPYAAVANRPVRYVDPLGLTAKVSVKYFPPKPKEIAPEVTEGGESGTSYPFKKVKCWCNCPKGQTHWLMTCHVGFTARIRVSKKEANAWGTTVSFVYGHEQRHVLSRTERVRGNVVKPLEQEDGEFVSEDECDDEAGAYQSEYEQKLKDQLTWEKNPDHKGDPGATEHSPTEGKGEPPLDGSVYPPKPKPRLRVP